MIKENKKITTMKTLSPILIAIFLMISFSAFSQNEKWKQKNARINFALTPQFEYVKIAGKYSPTASFSGSISFNNTYFIGGYLTKKIITNYNNYEILPTTDLDANFQQGGMEFLYAKKLGLYRTKGGHYVYPKLRIVFGARLGVGLVWLDDINKTRYTESDYFGYIQPMAGVSYPVSDFITLRAGATFTTTVKIQKLDAYVNNKDFMGPGVYLGAKFTVFR